MNPLKSHRRSVEKVVMTRRSLFLSLLTVDLVSLVWLVSVLLGALR